MSLGRPDAGRIIGAVSEREPAAAADSAAQLESAWQDRVLRRLLQTGALLGTPVALFAPSRRPLMDVRVDEDCGRVLAQRIRGAVNADSTTPS